MFGNSKLRTPLRESLGARNCNFLMRRWPRRGAHSQPILQEQVAPRGQVVPVDRPGRTEKSKSRTLAQLDSLRFQSMQ